MIIPESVKSLIKRYSELSDDEVCGYWIPSKSDLVIHCENISSEPSDSFEIDVDEHLKITTLYKDPVIWHTHNSDSIGSTLSNFDILNSKASKIPYLLYHTEFDEWDYYDPNCLNPYPLKPNIYPESDYRHYLSHLYSWDRWDCYSLFKNYYKGVLGIELKDFNRGGNESVILSSHWDKFTLNFESQGFRKLDYDEPVKIHDVALMCLVGNQIHHAAIMISDNTAIHCLGEESISKEFYFSDSHKRRTRMYIRHKSLDY